jgi:C4-dicarboxylate transporter DctM subunit
LVLALTGFFVFLVGAGVPISFSMGFSAALALLLEGRVPLALVVQRLFSGVDSFPIMAVPFFIMAGFFMDSGGISTRLVALARTMVGHIRGSLAMVVVIAEVFFSGISGSTTADISAIGSTLIPAMTRDHYKPEQAAAIVAAASSMGVLIPPCIMLVVLGSLVNISVGKLFFAGFLPGFVMAIGLLVLIYWQARRGILPAAAATQRSSLVTFLRAIKDSLLAFLMPVIIFGGILWGVATPTEIAAVATLYSFIVTVFVYKELKWKEILAVMEKTILITGAALFLVGLATTFSWILSSQQVPEKLANLILSISSTPFVFTILSMVLFMLAGCFLEGLPAIIVLVPIFIPAANLLHIDTLHYSIVAVGAVGIGGFLPPTGIGLLLSAGIAGKSVQEVSRPFMPYLYVLIACMLVITIFPWITLVVPRIFMD